MSIFLHGIVITTEYANIVYYTCQADVLSMNLHRTTQQIYKKVIKMSQFSSKQIVFAKKVDDLALSLTQNKLEVIRICTKQHMVYIILLIPLDDPFKFVPILLPYETMTFNRLSTSSCKGFFLSSILWHFQYKRFISIVSHCLVHSNYLSCRIIGSEVSTARAQFLCRNKQKTEIPFQLCTTFLHFVSISAQKWDIKEI